MKALVVKSYGVFSAISNESKYQIRLAIGNDVISGLWDRDIDIEALLPSEVAALIRDHAREAIYDSALPRIEAFFAVYSPEFKSIDLEFCEAKIRCAQALVEAWETRKAYVSES